MFTIYAFGTLLILLAATLLVSHWRAWVRSREDATLSEEERRFAWRQFRRRSQSSGMIGLVGLGICLYELVPRDELVVTVYLGGMILVVLWVLLLAVGDLIDTRVHFRRIRREHKRAHARFVEELNQQSD